MEVKGQHLPNAFRNGVSDVDCRNLPAYYGIESKNEESKESMNTLTLCT